MASQSSRAYAGRTAGPREWRPRTGPGAGGSRRHAHRAGADRMQKVPFAAPRIDEDCDLPVRFAPRRFKKIHPARTQRLIITLEIIGHKEIAHAPASLISDPCPLGFVARNGKDQLCSPASGRRHDHPALVGANSYVLQSHKTKHVAEKGQALLVAGNKERDGGETLDHFYRVI